MCNIIVLLFFLFSALQHCFFVSLYIKYNEGLKDAHKVSLRSIYLSFLASTNKPLYVHHCCTKHANTITVNVLHWYYIFSPPLPLYNTEPVSIIFCSYAHLFANSTRNSLNPAQYWIKQKDWTKKSIRKKQQHLWSRVTCFVRPMVHTQGFIKWWEKALWYILLILQYFPYVYLEIANRIFGHTCILFKIEKDSK